jgi:predicted PurR-regulated permease PerM
LPEPADNGLRAEGDPIPTPGGGVDPAPDPGTGREQVLIRVPRWAQAVLLPVAVFLAIFFARAMGHALFTFVLAVLLALLLNPLVRGLQRLRVPRVAAVPLVYLTLIAVIVVLAVVWMPALVNQVQTLVKRIPEWGQGIDARVHALQAYLDHRRIPIDVQRGLGQALAWVQSRSAQSAGTIFNVGLGVAGSLATLFVIVIASFYMLIDGARLHRFLLHILPGDEADMDRYLLGLQASFSRYVKGQFVVGLTMGFAAGIGVWIFGMVGIWPEATQYALLFGVWAGVMELVPYVGPWLGAAPPTIAALFHSPMTAVWVLILFVVLQQIEGHVLVPNIMGTSVGVHPLVVIFVLLAAFEMGGVVGMLAALPILAMLKHTVDFFDVRLSRDPWGGDDLPPPGPAPPQAAPVPGSSAPGRNAPAEAGERVER